MGRSLWAGGEGPEGTPRASALEQAPGRPGLTCPAVQEADAPVVMGGDGEGLVRVAHHLVDLRRAWMERGGEGVGGAGRPGQRPEEEKHVLQPCPLPAVLGSPHGPCIVPAGLTGESLMISVP